MRDSNYCSFYCCTRTLATVCYCARYLYTTCMYVEFLLTWRQACLWCLCPPWWQQWLRGKVSLPFHGYWLVLEPWLLLLLMACSPTSVLCVCVCVCVWERERVSEWVSEWDREREGKRDCVHVCVCVWGGRRYKCSLLHTPTYIGGYTRTCTCCTCTKRSHTSTHTHMHVYIYLNLTCGGYLKAALYHYMCATATTTRQTQGQLSV